MPPQEYDVIVLGAGLAGLGAAKELIEQGGLRVCILEAQHRAGGRVCTVPLNTWEDQTPDRRFRVEAGAQWLHGKDNSLFEIAERHGLLSDQPGEEGRGQFIRNDGYVFDPSTVKKIDFEVGRILEECEDLITLPNLKEISIQEVLEKKFLAYLDQNPELNRDHALELFDWHLRFQVIDNSCPNLGLVSANQWGTYSFNGENNCQAHINVRNGLDELVNVLLDAIGRKNVHFNQEVKRINWNVPGQFPIEICCKTGEKYRAKCAIPTFSIGVLKKTMNDLFFPDLPDEFEDSVFSTGFGTINKIYLKFDADWGENFEGIQLVWKSNNNHVQCPDWVRWITGFDMLENGILVGWIGGPGALEMEKIQDREIAEACVDLLRNFLKMNLENPSHFYW